MISRRPISGRKLSGGRVWPETEAKARAFMRDYRPRRRKSHGLRPVGSPEDVSGARLPDSGAGAPRSGFSQNSEFGGRHPAERRRREAPSHIPARAAASDHAEPQADCPLVYQKAPR